MMQVSITDFMHGLYRTVDNNSPAILAGVAVAGVVSTAVLAGKASFKASEIVLMRDEEMRDAEETRREVFIDRTKRVWKLYIPAVATGVVTIVSVVGSNRISNRRSAALVTAYSLTERAFSDYKEKVVEQLGQNKERKVRDSIAQDHVDKNPVTNNVILLTDGGDVLCYETMTGRYFTSSMEALRRAQNDINAQIISDMSATQNEFYHLIGLDSVGYGEEVGWNNDHMLDLQFTSVLTKDGKPCLSIGYQTYPVRGYDSLH